MTINSLLRRFRLPLVLGFCLALMVGMQAVEVSHLHSNDQAAPDCVLCQLDSGSQVIAALPQTPIVADSVAVTAILSFAVYSHTDYSFSARGPPQLSC